MSSKHTRGPGSFVPNKSFNANIGDPPVNELRRMNGLKSLTEQHATCIFCACKYNMHRFDTFLKNMKQHLIKLYKNYKKI